MATVKHRDCAEKICRRPSVFLKHFGYIFLLRQQVKEEVLEGKKSDELSQSFVKLILTFEEVHHYPNLLNWTKNIMYKNIITLYLVHRRKLLNASSIFFLSCVLVVYSLKNYDIDQ